MTSDDEKIILTLLSRLKQASARMREQASVEDENAEQTAFERAYTLNKRHDRVLYRALIEDFMEAIKKQPSLARQLAEQIVKLGCGEILSTIADELQKGKV